MIKPPFKLPVDVLTTTSGARFMTADDAELVAEIYAASDAEMAYIVEAINTYPEALRLLKEVTHVLETPGDFDEQGRNDTRREAGEFLAELGQTE